MINNISDLAANVQTYQETDITGIWRKTRRMLGYGTNELANALGISGAQISRIESGERRPAAELIIKFASLKEAKMFKIGDRVITLDYSRFWDITTDGHAQLVKPQETKLSGGKQGTVTRILDDGTGGITIEVDLGGDYREFLPKELQKVS